MSLTSINTTKKWIAAAAVVALVGAMVELLVFRALRHCAEPRAVPVESPRDPEPVATATNPVPLDLKPFLNGQLDKPWNPTSYPGDDLAELPVGVQELDGVRFDIRGLVQLSGRVWKQRGCPFPEKVEGIPVRRPCRYLYLLHADGGAPCPPGTTVALLVLHYDDGTQAELPIQHDIHVKDWWSYGHPPPSDPNTVVAWTGQNEATARMGNSIRLYRTRFDNSHPEKQVETLDYVSAMADPGPFLVALTV